MSSESKLIDVIARGLEPQDQRRNRKGKMRRTNSRNKRKQVSGIPGSKLLYLRPVTKPELEIQVLNWARARAKFVFV